MLRNIEDPPEKIYVLGNIENLNCNAITIVGSRKASNYGKKAAEYISYKLSKMDYVIISGLAKGIDSYAHIGTLKAKGRTIAVLATPLNRVYPPQNRGLAIEIINNNGTIISENPIGYNLKNNDFLRRNRIMSGMVREIVVVEASKNSGSLTTASYALSQGREVYAVPR